MWRLESSLGGGEGGRRMATTRREQRKVDLWQMIVGGPREGGRRSWHHRPRRSSHARALRAGRRNSHQQRPGWMADSKQPRQQDSRFWSGQGVRSLRPDSRPGSSDPTRSGRGRRGDQRGDLGVLAAAALRTTHARLCPHRRRTTGRPSVRLAAAGEGSAAVASVDACIAARPDIGWKFPCMSDI
jgi:hypothetical protein